MATTDRPVGAVTGNIKLGVQLSWEEAVRVIPALAAAEAQRLCDALEDYELRDADFRKQILYYGNAQRDALIELREAIVQMGVQELQGVSHYPEYERIRYYIEKAQRVLGWKK